MKNLNFHQIHTLPFSSVAMESQEGEFNACPELLLMKDVPMLAAAQPGMKYAVPVAKAAGALASGAYEGGM